MATFTITTAQNMTALTGKGGSDTYNVNGGVLTIDSDTRYGPNTSTSAGPMGNVSSSAALGGAIVITGANVRLIPFSTGAGVVPVSGAIVSRAGVTAELLCVMALRTGGAVTAAGAAMPASGWMKVRNVTGGAVTAGALTGISASATAADEAGWLELVGVETLSISIPRLGTLSVAGEWFYLTGTTSGTRGQTFALPAFDAITEYPGVEIETAAGSGVYKFWPNAGIKFTGASLGSDSRSRMVGITSAGVLTLGTGRDAASAGDLPPAGCRIRIPNIIFSSCSVANRLVNVIPSGTMGNRYEFATASAGVVSFSKCTGSWYANIQQAYSVTLLDVHSCDQITLSECATAPVINGLHVGLSNQATALPLNALVFQQCYAGATVNNISGLRAEAISTSGYANTFTNLYGTWIFNNVRGHYASDATAMSGPLFFNTCDDITVNDPEVIGKRLIVSGCGNVEVNRMVYADNTKNTTQSTVAAHALEFMGNTKVARVNGILNWPGVANVHPYSGLIYINTVFDLVVRNIGTAAAPFDCGTVNPTGYLFSDGGNTSRCRFQRNWLTGVRLGLSSSTNTSKRVSLENCYSTDATKTQGPNYSDSTVRGNRQNSGSVPTSYVGVYGTCFWDAFTGDTTTRAAVVFVEKTPFTVSAYTIDAGAPKFTAGGTLVLQSTGDRITWTWNYAILGWSGLASFAVTGTNTGGHLLEYDLDKGAGFSGVFKTLNSINLLAETGISPTTGVTPRVRITCSTGASTNQLTSLVINGTTTLALQNAALYPLDTAMVSLTGLQSGSTVAVFAGVPTPGQVPMASGVAIVGTTASFSYPYDTAVASYTLRIRKAGCDPVELVYVNALATSIPVAQQENKDGFGVAIYGRGTGSSSAFVSFDAAAQRIDIGNSRCVAEDVYNVVALWQATLAGIVYPEALRFDGTDLLILGAWRFRRALATYTSAGIDALPVIDGNPTGSPDDEANGSVDFRARSVRTYQLSAAPAITAADMAAAVWGYAQGNGSTAEANLRAARTAAENAFAVSA